MAPGLLSRCHGQLGLQTIAMAPLTDQACPDLQHLSVAGKLGTGEAIGLKIAVHRVEIRMARTAGEQPA